MLLRTEAFRSAGEADTVVGFLSSAQVYLSNVPADTISSGSYTPHASCEEVILVIGCRVQGANTITGFTVTINSVAPSEIVAFNTASAGHKTLWMARWRGAPSGTVAITTANGGDWTSLAVVGISLDRDCVEGASVKLEDSASSAATTTGDQTITSEQADSIGIFAVCINEPGTAMTPDATDTYTEIYEDGTTGSDDIRLQVGYRALGAVGSKTFECDWTSSVEWASLLVEYKAV